MKPPQRFLMKQMVNFSMMYSMFIFFNSFLVVFCLFVGVIGCFYYESEALEWMIYHQIVDYDGCGNSL